MSIFGGILAGSVVGFYFAEKNLPFPLRYNKRPEGKTGSLEFDLQVVDVIIRDLKSSVGYHT
ncbi:MAG: hypothetical protein KDD45_18245 [Bdellovibrionales bacterium]|nr:hypothetical protein [Bdellovibrionales bacterium]